MNTFQSEWENHTNANWRQSSLYMNKSKMKTKGFPKKKKRISF